MSSQENFRKYDLFDPETKTSYWDPILEEVVSIIDLEANFPIKNKIRLKDKQIKKQGKEK